jgi:nicotinamidase-related amidase
MDEHTMPHYSKSALLTIDMQMDFMDEGISAVGGTRERLPEMIRIVQAYRDARRPVVHVVRLYHPDGVDADRPRRQALQAGISIVRPHTPGSQLVTEIAATSELARPSNLLAGSIEEIGANEYVMYKPRWNAFFRTNLTDWLVERQVDTVVISGCNYPNCPRATAFGASERDFRVAIVTDAVSRWYTHADREMRSIGVIPTRAAGVIQALSAL